MTRRFLDDVRADIDAVIVPNGAGAITAALMNPIMHDMIDSTIDDEGGIFGVTPVTGIPVTAAFSELLTLFTTELGGDGTFIIPAAALGQVTSSAVAGFTYNALVQLSVECANNSQFDFTVMQDGIAIGVGESVTGRGTGNGRPVAVNIETLILSAPADAVYTVGVKSPDGNSNINVIKASLFIVVKPTNNP